MSDFAFAVKHTLEAEGVFSNNKNDPGGKTKYGVTERMWIPYWWDNFGKTQPPDIERINVGHAIAFYKDVFWDALRIDRMNDKHIAAEVFDSAVNVGAGDAVMFLQRAINYNRLPTWERIKVDGVLGPVTRGKTQDLIDLNHRVPLLKAQNGFQFMHYVEQDNPHFSRGWTARIQLASELA